MLVVAAGPDAAHADERIQRRKFPRARDVSKRRLAGKLAHEPEWTSPASSADLRDTRRPRASSTAEQRRLRGVASRLAVAPARPLREPGISARTAQGAQARVAERGAGRRPDAGPRRLDHDRDARSAGSSAAASGSRMRSTLAAVYHTTRLTSVAIGARARAALLGSIGARPAALHWRVSPRMGAVLLARVVATTAEVAAEPRLDKIGLIAACLRAAAPAEVGPSSATCPVSSPAAYGRRLGPAADSRPPAGDPADGRRGGPRLRGASRRRGAGSATVRREGSTRCSRGRPPRSSASSRCSPRRAPSGSARGMVRRRWPSPPASTAAAVRRAVTLRGRLPAVAEVALADGAAG